MAQELLTEHIDLAGSFCVPVDGRPPGTVHHESRSTHTYRNRKFSPGFPDSTTFEVFMKSSNVLSAGYNPDRSVLYVKFHNGDVYEYEGVPLASSEMLTFSGPSSIEDATSQTNHIHLNRLLRVGYRRSPRPSVTNKA